jgi:RNA polymerase sigma-70 factor (ECF subfamily)
VADPTDDRSDQALIAALNGGDDRAFDALYYRYRGWVVRLAQRFTRNPDDALDVLQETFAYLARKIPGFRLTCAMTSFLYPVVKNLSIAARKKSARFAAPDPSLEPAAGQAAHTDRGELSSALGALPEPQREVLLMRFVDDLSLQEIADALGVPLGTVKSRLHHAIATLRADPKLAEWFRE